jgi:hypothetical protein
MKKRKGIRGIHYYRGDKVLNGTRVILIKKLEYNACLVWSIALQSVLYTDINFINWD